MRKKETEIQGAVRNAGLDINLQDIMDGMEDELLVIDREYKVRLANSVVRDRFQKGGESPLGRLCYEVLYDRDRPCTAPLLDCPLTKVLESGKITTVIHPTHILEADTYLKITVYPLWDNYGNTMAVVELRSDVTAAKETERELGRRYDELLALSRVSAALSGLWDLDAVLRVALDNMLKIMNGTIGGILLLDEETQMLSYRVHRGLSTRYAEEMRVSLGEGVAGSVAQSGKSILLDDISADPRAAHPELVSNEGLKAFISVPLRAKDKVLGVINVASRQPHCFTSDNMHLLHSIGDQLGVAIEQASLYERLRRARERLRKLARQNLVAEEEERRRIARELHDETSQSLSGLALQLEALIERYAMAGNQDAEFIAGLKKVQSLTVQVHKEVSRLISDLRPALLDTLGLIPAVRQHAETRLQPLGINVSIEIKGTERRLTPDVETVIFRCVQGDIGNIVQHSKAKNAVIVLEYQPNELLLSISDDGQGFNVSEITDVEESGRGRGLFSMRERVGFLGGTSGVESQIGVGTTVWAKVPIGQDIEYAENKSLGSR
ncbi:GAF domain-containing protein [Chloroflexota bacterium]